MRCPSCGAITQQHSIECSECGAIQDNEAPDLFGDVQTDIVKEPASTSTKHQSRPARSLIEFPGVKNSIPQWRKELGERVREVQEKRAREAMIEAGQVDSGAGEIESKIPLLELLPRTEVPPVNPILVAALQRIERAHRQPRFAGNTAVATMVAYDEQSEFGLEVAPSMGDGGNGTSHRDDPYMASTRSERVHNLAVVPRHVTTETSTSASVGPPPMEAMTVDDDSLTFATPEATAPAVQAEPTQRPRRIIGDLNNPALNYLDSISVAVVDIPEMRPAPIFFRFLSAILDIGVVCVLSAPVVAMVKLTDLTWQDPRTLMFTAGTLIVMGFLYLTVSTAFTGRTLGMKPFSLRVVDARTGLIPTGGQSAARAVLYLLSLASAGVALIYTLANSERLAAHDRFTSTAVVRG